MWVLLVMGPMDVLLPFIARERFVHGGQTYGFLLAAFGLGSAVGALAVSTRSLPRRYLTVMMMLWGLGTLPLAVVGVTWSFPTMAVALFMVGLASGAGMVIWGTLLQRRVPAQMLGRVASLDFFVSLSFMPVSMALAGPLSKVVPVPMIFAAAGVLPIALAVVALAAARMPRDEVAHPFGLSPVPHRPSSARVVRAACRPIVTTCSPESLSPDFERRLVVRRPVGHGRL